MLIKSDDTLYRFVVNSILQKPANSDKLVAVLKSLELNWIRNCDKSLVIPEITFEPIEEYGGEYLPPDNCEVLVNDRWIDSRYGIIVISSLYPENIEINIAHEWRHHWQVHHGWRDRGKDWSRIVQEIPDYDKRIVHYFTTFPTEMDALCFERKHSSPNITVEFWWELLQTGYQAQPTGTHL
jgi:hypothetical protein